MGDKEQHQQTATMQVYTWSTGNGHGTVAQKPEDPAAAELEIAVGHWPFSNQFAPFGRANPIC